VLRQFTDTVSNMLNMVNKNIDTIQEVSKVGNIKAKSFVNALEFDEQIRKRLRDTKKYQQLRAKQIMQEELNKLNINNEVQDNDSQDDENSFDDLISEFEQNITF